MQGIPERRKSYTSRQGQTSFGSTCRQAASRQRRIPRSAVPLGIEGQGAETPRGKRQRVIRLEVVGAGFKHCRQTRDYRTIIAVAQRIPENVLQEEPRLLMWYDQALTRMETE